jgi:hypothetical protein
LPDIRRQFTDKNNNLCFTGFLWPISALRAFFRPAVGAFLLAGHRFALPAYEMTPIGNIGLFR